MSLITDEYEYINEDTIKDELKCIICTQPFQSPVSSYCKHTFCRSCIETWIQQNNSCPICRHPLEAQSIATNTASNILLNQLDSLLVRCLKCNDASIKRANFDAHLRRCSKKKTRKTSNLFRKPWDSVKTLVRTKFNRRTRVINFGNIIYRVRWNIQHRRYRQRSFDSNLRMSQTSAATKTAVARVFEAVILLIFILIGFTLMAILLFFVITFILIYLGIFCKVLFVVFVIGLSATLCKRN